MALAVEVGFAVGLALLAVIPAAMVSRRTHRVLTNLALALFRDRVRDEGRRRQQRARTLQAVHAATTYQVYASVTLLYAAIVGLAGTLIAVWVIQRALLLLVESEQALRAAFPPQLVFLVPSDFATLSLTHVFVLLLVSGATFGTGGAALTYAARWWFVANLAEKRAVLIDESLARTIAFVYALSRSGMVFPEIMRTVAENRRAFGESAEEVAVLVKDMDFFGADLVTAMQRMARRTPSEQFADFLDNFANILRGGRNVAAYLRDQYDQHQAERVANQERLLELFTALGEAYVAGLVAGPLFFITILVIFGVVAGGVLGLLQAFVYLLLPLASLGFVIYLDTVAEPLKSFEAPIKQGVAPRPVAVRRTGDPGTGAARPDGGVTRRHFDLAANRRRFAAYARLERYRTMLLNPVRTVVREPTTLLWVTVPIALVALVVRAWPAVAAGRLDAGVLDDYLIQSGLFVVATFAVVREVHTRRIRRIEGALPDLLDRLASTNEAGMTFTESLRRVEKGDLGALDVEVQRLLSDINWGARTERALHRFNARIGSSSVARVVALITNAMLASGHLGPVIRIAADEAREDRRLKRSRRQEMLVYVVIVYLSFVVFLGIAVALQTILIPAIPPAGELAPAADGGAPGTGLPFTPAAGAERAAYSLVLFHAAVIQAGASGFIAGQMGEGSLMDGAKHAALMVLAAYFVFLAIL